jgi:hypothetical protein
MPFSGNLYTPPNGATNAAPGQVLQSAVWDAIFTDLASALTTLMTQANTTPTWSNILAANGGFSVWQRGAGAAASFAVPASTIQYTADRWYVSTGANQASVVAAATGLTIAAPASHAAKITRNSGQTGTGTMFFGYPLTTDEVVRLRGQQISFSGAAKAGANWSPTGGTLVISIAFGTGTPTKTVNGFTGLTLPLVISTNIAAGASNLSITGTSSATVATNATQGEVQISWFPIGTAGADDSITLDQICLVAGAVVQSFEDLPFDESLLLCKKFYRKSFPYGTAPVQNGGLAGAISVVSQAAASFGFYVQFEPVEMFATASFTSYSPSGATANWVNNTVGTSSVAATFDTNGPSAKGVLINGAVTSASVTLFLHYSADAGI